MNNTPLVTVILPVYNQEKYLDAAYNCLVGQSYTNLELIFVNDGSTDRSAEMLKTYAQQDSRVRVVEKPNGGLVDATLAGIAAATGEYICFLDPDDQLGPDYIRFYLDLMTDELDFVAAGYYTEQDGVRTPHCLTEDRVYSESELRFYTNTLLYESGPLELSHRFFVSRCNKLYRKSIVDVIVPLFSSYKHITLGEDTLFTYLLLQHSRGCRTVCEANTYYYNIGNSDSMTKTIRLDRFLAQSKAIFSALHALTKTYGTDESQAYISYGFYIDGMIGRTRSQHPELRRQLSRKLLFDKAYHKACRLFGKPFPFVKNLVIAAVPASFVLKIQHLKESIRS